MKFTSSSSTDTEVPVSHSRPHPSPDSSIRPSPSPSPNPSASPPSHSSRYSHLSSLELLSGIQSARQQEKRILADLLHYLLEIERRKAHLDWGYSSLFVFLTEGLGYEKASAYRRLEALRAMRELPEIEGKLLSGALSLSTLGQVRQVIRHEEKTLARSLPISEKRELFAQVEGRSQSEAERVLVEARPAAMRAIQDRARRSVGDRPLPGHRWELRIEISEQSYARWEKLKDLRSQACFERSGESLLDWLIELGLERADPERRERRRQVRREKRGNPVKVKSSETQEPRSSKLEGLKRSELEARPSPSSEPTSSAAEPPSFRLLRDQVFRRDGGSCAHVSAITGRRCSSRHALEIDHVWPRSRGGSDSLGNLRVLCDSHNRGRTLNPRSS